MLKVGDRVAGYEIVAELKSGGMATLYLGRRAGMGGFAKHVAIKLIHPHLAKDEKFVGMFLDEARLSARIEHPNVVHVHDLGEDDGMYFMVMEYVNGCSLAQLLRALAERRRKLSTELATWIAMRVAAGLDAAHDITDERGRPLEVVHRDVSPQNVLIAYKGYVKLIDFGIAKARGRTQNTNTGLLKGKLRYMSPEQASGKPIDRRTDVYALGVMLWEMLTMRKLFDAENELLLLDQVRAPEIVPPIEIAPEIPEALSAAVMHALAHDPDERPSSAHDLGQELARAVPGALAIDTPQLSTLVRTILASDIDVERRHLPDSLSGVLMAGTEEPPFGERVVDEMTMSLDSGDLRASPVPSVTSRGTSSPRISAAPVPAQTVLRRPSSRPPALGVEGQAALARVADSTPAPGTSSGIVRSAERHVEAALAEQGADRADGGAFGDAGAGVSRVSETGAGAAATGSIGAASAQPAPPSARPSRALFVIGVAIALLAVVFGGAVVGFLVFGAEPVAPTVIQLEERAPSARPEATTAPVLERETGEAAPDPTADEDTAPEESIAGAEEPAAERAEDSAATERERRARADARAARARARREAGTTDPETPPEAATDDVPLIDDVQF